MQALKLLLGIPILLLSLLLAYTAVVTFQTDESATARIVTVILGVLSLILFLVGKRFVFNRGNTDSGGRFGHPQTATILDESFEFVTIASSGKISVHASTAAEAKLAIKELRLLKKSFAIEKRQVRAQKKAIRAEYTHDVRKRGSKFRGRGGFGRFVRSMQTASRDSARADLARALKPLEAEDQRLAHAMRQIDSLIVQVDAQALRLP